MTRKLKLLVLVFFAFLMVFAIFDRQLSPSVAGAAAGEPLAAPTDVYASDGMFSQKIGIHWNTVRGATLYRVFRNTSNSPGSATDVGTSVTNYFYDTNCTVNLTYYYWVRAENGGNVSTFSSSDQGIRLTGTPVTDPFHTLEPPPAPVGNPITAVKASLGKTLFWDEQLSSTGTMACGTCHRPSHGGSDPRTGQGPGSINPGPDGEFGTEDDIFGSPGVVMNEANGTYSFNPIFGYREQVTGRKAPSYLNASYSANGLFWDGRAIDEFRDPITNNIVLASIASLESQSSGPPVSSGEMGHVGRDWTQVAARIQAAKPLALASNIPASLAEWINGRTYPELFQEAFGSPDVTPARISMAIATHERSIFSDNAPIDRELQGIPTLTAQELSGMNIFIAQQCNTCHEGAIFSRENFENIGVRPITDDPGRGGVTGFPDDIGRFKTPNLRNLELRAPYMHNGRFPTIESVVEFYNRGGDYIAPNVDTSLIHPLNLSPQERADLSAFMKRPLTDPRVRDELPPFDRPQLYTESNRVPVISGAGRAGSGGQVPNAIALEPPLLGNQSFTVAVSNGLGAAAATLVINSTDPGVGAGIPSSGSFAHVMVTLGGKGNGAGYGSVSLAIPNNPSLIGQTFYGRWYVVDPNAANGFSVSRLFQFTVFGNAVVTPHTPFDFDGDSKSDISIFRPSVGEWWYLRSIDGGNRAFQFGSTTDMITPGDYTGDGKTDVGFWRPSTGEWYILRSEDGSYYSFPFGTTGDVPVPSDYDGDGKTDTAVFRPSNNTWYILNSHDLSVTFTTFGAAGDKPVPADYDGDAKSDVAIYRPGPGEWWYLRSIDGGNRAFQFGQSTDKPVQGDFTGDGKADVAFFRPSSGEWFILRSEDGSYYSFPFGLSTDIPAPGDYDGDGKIDATVFRPSSSTWFSNTETAGVIITTFGSLGDKPVPGAFVP